MMRNRLTRLTGMGGAATAALALLVFGCVFAVTAGPREALATRTQALRQTLAATPALAQTIVVTATWNGVTTALGAAEFGAPGGGNLTAAQLGEITGQLHGDFDRGVVHLAPPGADWAAMTSGAHTVTSTLPAVSGVPVHLEVTYRQPLTQYTRLVAGRYPAATANPAQLPVLVSPQTARQFGLHLGSKMKITGPQIELSGSLEAITLVVAGIVVPRDPVVDVLDRRPDRAHPGPGDAHPQLGVLGRRGIRRPGRHQRGAAGLRPGGAGPCSGSSRWSFGSLDGQQAQPLYDALNRLGAQSPTLTGDVAPAAGTLQVTAGLLQPLAAFLATAQSVDVLLWLLYVSLAVAGLVVLLLAARMVAMRRSAELTMRRARGASLRQIAAAAGARRRRGLRPGRRPRRARRGAARPRGGTGARGGTGRRLAAADSGAARRGLRPGRHRGLAAAAAPAPARRPAPPARPGAAGRRGDRRGGGGRRDRRLPAAGHAARIGREPLHQRRPGAGRDPGGDRGAAGVPGGAARAAARLGPAAPGRPRSSASPGRPGPRSPRRCPRSRWSSRSAWPRSRGWCGTRSPTARSRRPGRPPGPT